MTIGLFDGVTYDDALDRARLSKQIDKVYAFLAKESAQQSWWWTLDALSINLHIPQASISARLRDLRKPRFGSHSVLRRRHASGWYAYRLEPNPDAHNLLPTQYAKTLGAKK